MALVGLQGGTSSEGQPEGEVGWALQRIFGRCIERELLMMDSRMAIRSCFKLYSPSITTCS